ncbi:hypothetical protein KGR20_21105 [Cytobacillus oceanisediminis]|uniref:hypothetical protein n=1 Tax=Cytobacillus oceanisediminis TaxID=665099 RepID=UPI001CCDF2DC|nr:hypothetical protein [Cytobacillus oceanisediminis]MBZ9536665.1 hypothetical protein [Cytobacillus oceanisediminis]
MNPQIKNEFPYATHEKIYRDSIAILKKRKVIDLAKYKRYLAYIDELYEIWEKEN